MNKKIDIVKCILDHPEKDEILSKLALGSSAADISEWLNTKYADMGERKYILSEKNLQLFYDDYFDFYTLVREDALKVQNGQSPGGFDPMQEILQQNTSYMSALTNFAEQEVDIKAVAKRLILNIETRASQVFDLAMEDPRNIRNDKTLIEWMNTLWGVIQQYDKIQNPGTQEVNIQNNINIQVVDKHINTVINLVTGILQELDVDASMKFMDMWNTAITKLNMEEIIPLPIAERANQVKMLETNIASKIEDTNDKKVF